MSTSSSDAQIQAQQRNRDEGLIGAAKRRHHRIKTDWWVRINVPWEVSTQIVDISLSGARFKGELPCTPGVPIAFALEVPGIGDVPFTADVVWVRHGASGVQFTGVTGSRAKLLREALLEEERRVLRERCHPASPMWEAVEDLEIVDEVTDRMRAEGLEPTRPKPPAPKAGASTNFATPA